MRAAGALIRCPCCENVITQGKWGHHVYHCVRERRAERARRCNDVQ